MRKIIAIIFKDTLLRFSSPAEWLFFLILPVVFTVVLAGGTGGSSTPGIRLVVVDQASTPLSSELINALKKSQAVRPELLPLDQANQELANRNTPAVLVIPASFDLAHLSQGKIELELHQQPNNLDALAASRAVSSAAGRIGSAVDIANRSVAEAERIQSFASDATRQSYFDAALQAAQAQIDRAPNRVAVVEGSTVDPVQYDPRANSSAGQLITWVFVPLLGISGMFAYERQQGTLRRILTTSTRRSTYLLGTILGQVLISLVQMLLLVGFGALVMKLDWGESPAALAVILVSAALAAAALGTTLGTFVKTESQASGLSVMLGMVMALLGGCWYPLELFPAFGQAAAKVLPTTWAMQGLLDIVVRRQDLVAILPAAGVLLGFAAVFFTIGILRFRYE